MPAVKPAWFSKEDLKSETKDIFGRKLDPISRARYLTDWGLGQMWFDPMTFHQQNNSSLTCLLPRYIGAAFMAAMMYWAEPVRDAVCRNRTHRGTHKGREAEVGKAANRWGLPRRMNDIQIEVPGTQIARAVVYEDPLKAWQAHLRRVSYNDAIEGCKPLCENQSIEFTNQ